MKILTVVGNRPQFIKAAAVSGPLRERNEEILVHTGQHHDDSLSRVFFAELGLARPDRELGIAGGSNTSQTARMLAALEPLLEEIRPEAVLVYGDTNSTLAGALAAAQARHRGRFTWRRGCARSTGDARGAEPRAHRPPRRAAAVRFGDRRATNLEAESVAGRVEVVGDVMVDVAMRRQPSARADSQTLSAYGLQRGAYLLLTAHRAGNVDDPERLRALVELVGALPAPVLFALHPRTRARLKEAGLLEELMQLDGLTLTEPLGYLEFSALLCQARAVLTDSGGVQKEAYLAGVPCVTLRANTEWVETVDAGWNTLVDLDAAAALAALRAGHRRSAGAVRRRARRRALRRGDRRLRGVKGHGAMNGAAQPVRVGVVGLGYWGPNLARNFDAIPGCELRWLCDPSAEAREKPARSFPGARATGELSDLLAGRRPRRRRAGHARAQPRRACDRGGTGG